VENLQRPDLGELQHSKTMSVSSLARSLGDTGRSHMSPAQKNIVRIIFQYPGQVQPTADETRSSRIILEYPPVLPAPRVRYSVFQGELCALFARVKFEGVYNKDPGYYQNSVVGSNRGIGIDRIRYPVTLNVGRHRSSQIGFKNHISLY
jgi:hypothetical protein